MKHLTAILAAPAKRARKCSGSLDALAFWNFPTDAARVACPICDREFKVLSRGGHGQPRIPAHAKVAA